MPQTFPCEMPFLIVKFPYRGKNFWLGIFGRRECQVQYRGQHSLRAGHNVFCWTAHIDSCKTFRRKPSEKAVENTAVKYAITSNCVEASWFGVRFQKNCSADDSDIVHEFMKFAEDSTTVETLVQDVPYSDKFARIHRRVIPLVHIALHIGGRLFFW